MFPLHCVLAQREGRSEVMVANSPFNQRVYLQLWNKIIINYNYQNQISTGWAGSEVQVWQKIYVQVAKMNKWRQCDNSQLALLSHGCQYELMEWCYKSNISTCMWDVCFHHWHMSKWVREGVANVMKPALLFPDWACVQISAVTNPLYKWFESWKWPLYSNSPSLVTLVQRWSMNVMTSSCRHLPKRMKITRWINTVCSLWSVSKNRSLSSFMSWYTNRIHFHSSMLRLTF